MKRYLFIIALLFVLLGVSDTGKQLTADVIVSNRTGTSQSGIVAPFPINTTGLLNGGLIGSDGLSMDMQDSSGDEVAFAPSVGYSDIESCKLSDGGAFSTDTTDCNDSDVGDVGLFPGSGVDLEVDDAFYIGAHHPFRFIAISISTAGSFATDPAIEWEYCSTAAGACSVWTDVPNLADNTDGFTVSGAKTVSWDLADDFAESTVDSITAYWVRARVTALVTAANYNVQPVGSFMDYQMGIGYLFVCDTCDPDSGAMTPRTLSNGQSVQYELFTGQDTPRTFQRMFPGDAGYAAASELTSPSLDDAAFEITGNFPHLATGSARNLIATTGGSDNLLVAWDSAVDGAIDVTTTGMVDNCAIANAATGITDARTHQIEIEFETGVECRLVIDGTPIASEAISGSLATTGAAWAFVEDGSIYGIESIKYARLSLDPDVNTVNNWTLTDLATFTSLNISDTVGAIALTPSFPDITADLSATTGTLMSATAVGGATTETNVPDVVGVVSGPSNFTGVLVPTVTLPGNEAITEIANVTGPVFPTIALYIFAGAIAAIAMLIFSYRLTGSYFWSGGSAFMVICAVYALSIFPFWVVFPVAILGLAILVVGKGLVVGA